MDSIRPDMWRRVDRTYGSLQLGSILDGLRAYAADYTGELSTETMLCGGVGTVAQRGGIESGIPVSLGMCGAGRGVSGYEGSEFAHTGDAAQDILSITAVHPMRDDAVSQLLERSRAEWSVVQDLIEAEQLVESVYEGLRSYLRRLFRRA
ncbi:MAG: hypothetical protein MUQ10_08880 [Anaerolineae bacterium]|nr:hypothetical protein [Anaerolineae bacterium]